MKIDAKIRDRFERQEKIAQQLKAEVDRDIMKRKLPSWHYESRVKKDESFALKIETGRVHDLDAVEDVFAATIVVPNATQIEDAVDLVTLRYQPSERRPPSPTSTTKAPDSFRFDDVRLYVCYQRTEGEKTAIPNGVLFEVQIKTFLQHAWAVATHDVVYKADQRDWRRERIAHQIRATLEQAEVIIGSMETLAGTAVLPAGSRDIDELNAIIAILSDEWDSDSLPSDIRRLAESVRTLLIVIDRDREANRPAILEKLVVEGKARNAGAHSLDWSPYRAVLNYAATAYSQKFKNRITNRSMKKQRILVYPEVLDLLSVTKEQAVAGVVVDEAPPS